MQGTTWARAYQDKADRSRRQANQLSAQLPQLRRLDVVSHLFRDLVFERALAAGPRPVGATLVQLGVGYDLRNNDMIQKRTTTL